MIIFEGKEITLHHHKGSSNYILITFQDKNSSNFFLKKIVETYNISCLGFTSKIMNYYLHEDTEKAISLCNNISKEYQNIIVIGLCLAGYAALKYSKRLNASIVFTMTPRCTVDNDTCPITSQTESNIVSKLSIEEIKQSTIRATDLQGQIYLLYDPLDIPKDIDVHHINYLRNLIPQASVIPTYFSGHVVVQHLRGTKVFKSIIDVLSQGKEQNIIKTVTHVRRHHIENITTKFTLLLKRYPLLIYKALIGSTFLKIKDNHQLFDNYQFRLMLCYQLNIHGYQQESTNFLKITFLYHTQNIHYDNNNINTLNPYPYLINFNGYYLSYNFVTKKLESMINISQKPYCLPLQLYNNNGRIIIVCFHSGVLFRLQYHEQETSLFNLNLLSHNDNNRDVKLSFSDYRTFVHRKNKKQYINISPKGDIHTATIPLEWESFATISMSSPTSTVVERCFIK